MILTSLEDWQRWGRDYSILPFIRSYSLKEDRPISWRKAWQHAKPGSFVLESGKDGRYTFLGLQPSSSIRGAGPNAVLIQEDGTLHHQQGNPLELVKQWMQPFRSPKVDGAPKWVGGCAGFWGYDVVRTLEKLPVLAKEDLYIPEYAFVRIDELWIIDHEEKRIYCAVHTVCPDGLGEDPNWLRSSFEETKSKAAQMKEIWDSIISVNRDPEEKRIIHQKQERISSDRLQINEEEAIAGVEADFSKEDYTAAVRKIQEYIGAGDVFQVNLSVRQHKVLEAKPEDIYEWLRLVNPSPYMGFLRFEDFQLVCGSPELLVQLEQGIVRTRPIAGTRPRGANLEEDARLADELIHHEKERAEHVMLVDLERNDLGKISKYGTVCVKDFMVIEYYSHVMHIVSQVEGQLSEGRDAFDVIAAAFPGGTITGAPKVRTMEIIEELEPIRRGPYTGSIGWIDYSGDMEFNIIIRTLITAGGIGYVQAGAGIVIDSVPEKEYVESVNKAKAMWKAIQYSESDNMVVGGQTL